MKRTLLTNIQPKFLLRFILAMVVGTALFAFFFANARMIENLFDWERSVLFPIWGIFVLFRLPHDLLLRLVLIVFLGGYSDEAMFMLGMWTVPIYFGFLLALFCEGVRKFFKRKKQSAPPSQEETVLE